MELADSDGEYDIGDSSHLNNDQNYHKVLHEKGWPSNVEFSNNYFWDPTIPDDIKNKHVPSQSINKTGRRQRANVLSNKVYFKKISDPDHPAFGEFGLYCSLPIAKPGEWLLDYVGKVSMGKDQDKTSDYLSDFGERSELACDANTFGNEARFLNDFRNTGKHPNVEFNLRRDKYGELRQGVFVKLQKDSKDKQIFVGIRKDEELLVTYGKNYWRSRIGDGGNLTDFIWRIPNAPMPKGGKPSTAINSKKEGEK